MHGWLIGTLLLLQITCSTLSQLLDSVLEQEGFQIGSVCGKKKRKAIKLYKSDLHNDVIRKDENALSFLSSILDTCSLIIICFFFLIFRCSNWQRPHAAATASSAPRRPYFTTTITPTNYDPGYPYLVSFCLLFSISGFIFLFKSYQRWYIFTETWPN